MQDRRALRSNFEPGTSRWAVRRAQWRALGLTDADMLKPKIAVINTSSEVAICFSHLDAIAQEVKAAIRAAGGLPFEIRTTAPSDFIISAGRRATYILPSRDLIANDIEVQVEGAQLDGMIMLTSCDKTMPGQLMAAARLDIPTLMVIGGYQRSGHMPDGRHVDIEDVFLHAGHHQAGRTSLAELTEMSEHAIRSPGACAGMGTANSMHCAVEALGMCLPGAAPVAAMSDAMWDHARASGRRIVDMVWEDLRPRKIMTVGAIYNAAAMVLSIAGSINCIKHLQAVAVEADVNVDVQALFEELGPLIPVLAAIRPIGQNSIEELEAAGGARAVLKRLEPMLDGTCLTATGQSLSANLVGVTVADDRVIRPVSDPFSNEPAIVLLRGSLAPDSGVVKIGLRGPDRPLRFRGPARVFETSLDAETALQDGRIKAGDVIVLRRQGVRGGPGMGGASRLVFALDGRDMGAACAVVTDGQLSGLVNKGLVVGEVQPEWADGGPIALVRDGDMIAIDVTAATIDLEVAESELLRRRAAFHPPEPVADSGWLSVYQRSVTPLKSGATLIASAVKK